MSDAFEIITDDGSTVYVTVGGKGDLCFSGLSEPFWITRGQLDDLIAWLDE